MCLLGTAINPILPYLFYMGINTVSNTLYFTIITKNMLLVN